MSKEKKNDELQVQMNREDLFTEKDGGFSLSPVLATHPRGPLSAKRTSRPPACKLRGYALCPGCKILILLAFKFDHRRVPHCLISKGHGRMHLAPPLNVARLPFEDN